MSDADRYWILGLKDIPEGVLAYLRPDPVSLREVLWAGRAVGDYGCEVVVVCTIAPDPDIVTALVKSGQSLGQQPWVVAILSARDIRAMISNIEAAQSERAAMVPLISSLSDEWH